MLDCERMKVSEGIGINKTNGVDNWIACHCNYSFEKSFNFQRCVCDACHNILQRAISFNDAGIFSLSQTDYRIHFRVTSKD